MAKVNAAGSALDYAGYIGGSDNDKPFGIAVDAAGGAYVTGETTSRETSFPNGQGFGSIPGFDKTYNNNGAEPSPPPVGGPTFVGDAFVAKVTPSGAGFGYATYFGGSSDDGAIPIEVDGTGAAYIAGATRSPDLPVKDGPDLSYGGQGDAFVAKLNPSGTDTVFASYIGGSLNDTGIGIAADAAGGVYTAGSTGSSQVEGFPVKVGPDTSFNGPSGGSDAFVAKISEVAPAQSPPGGGNVPGGGGGSVPPKATVCASSAGVRVIGRTNSGGRVIQGTNGNNRICGTSAGDVITGNGGKDVISGGGGDDRINGGSGSDRINGGSGKDRVSGSSGNDSISGSSGNDRINGNSGTDRISGSSGNDRLNGSTGNDVVSGSSGKDVISGSSGSDRLKGGSGNDRIDGGAGRDRISGGSGRNQIKQ